MKKTIICCVVAAMVLLSGCGKESNDDIPVNGTELGEVTAFDTEAEMTEAQGTEAPETEASTTDVPETDTPETKAPETEAPVTVTEAPSRDIEDGEKVAREYMDMLKSGQFYMEMSASTGDSSTVAMDMAGATPKAYMKVVSAGASMTLLVNQNGLYLIDDASRSYLNMGMPTDDSSSPMQDTGVEQVAEYKLTGSGMGTVKGAACPYITCEGKDSENESFIYRIYYRDGKVIGLQQPTFIPAEGVIVEGGIEFGEITTIKKYSKQLPAGIFELPAGYTEQKLEF